MVEKCWLDVRCASGLNSRASDRISDRTSSALKCCDQYRRTLRDDSLDTFFWWRFTAAAALRLRSVVGFS